MNDLPIGCGPEGTVSKHADIVNTLETMAGSYAYAARKGELREAARTIMRLERELADLYEGRDYECGIEHDENKKRRAERIAAIESCAVPAKDSPERKP